MAGRKAVRMVDKKVEKRVENLVVEKVGQMVYLK
jgi:hypothetical protein